MSTEVADVSVRPWVIGAAVLCATGTLGAVANASAPGMGLLARAPGTADLFRVYPSRVTIAGFGATAAATIVALLALRQSIPRSWPWLTLAGVVLTVPTLPDIQARVVREIPSTGPWVWATLGPAAPTLVLLGVLGAATWLIRIEAAGAGAVLLTAAFGAQVFGASLTPIGFVAPPDLEPPPMFGTEATELSRIVVVTVMTLAAVGGAFLLMALHHRYGRLPELAEPGRAESKLNPRLTVIGGLAALALVAAAAMVPGAVWVTPFGLPGVEPSLAGLTLAGSVAALVIAVVAAGFAGRTVLAGTVAVASVGVGIALPIRALSDRFLLDVAWIELWFLIALGVVIGAGAAFTRWRAWLAVGGCVTAVALLLLAGMASVQVPLLLFSAPMRVPLLLVLVAAATATVAAVGVPLAERSAVPVVLGPLAAAATFGGYGTLVWLQLPEESATGNLPTAVLDDPRYSVVYAVLLLLTAAILVGWQLRSRPSP